MACPLYSHAAKLLLVWAITTVSFPAMAELPLPPGFGSEFPLNPNTMRLRLELVVNGVGSGNIVAVEARDGTWLIDAQDLRGVHLRIASGTTGPVAINTMPQVQAFYDEAGQRLLLTVPSEWLPHQSLGEGASRVRIVPESSFGAVLNYDVYASGRQSGGGALSLLNEARIFGSFGTLRATSIYRRSLSRSEVGRFTRFDTGWAYVDDERIQTYEAGDLITRTLASGMPVRIGGFQISRDFAVRPDVITYPLPSFSGTASLPTAVDLFINGHQAAAEKILPGPFTFNGLPYASGSGEAVIVTTDTQGRRFSTSIPFYVSNTLLRPGMSDFAFSAGKLRRNFGLKNFSYGAMVASGAWRQGVTDWLTFEVQGQAARSLVVAGTGATVRLGQFGVVDLSALASHYSSKDRFQISAAYQYNNRLMSLMIRHVRRSYEFRDLGSYEDLSLLSPYRETQANASVSLWDQLGVLGVNYIETRRRGNLFRLAGLNYSKALWERGTLFVSANRDLVRASTSLMLQFSLPFGRNSAASAGLSRNADDQWRQHISYNKSLRSDGGLGWSGSLAHENNGAVTYQGDITWRTPSVQVQAGGYGRVGQDTVWGSIKGSLVVMDGGIFAANRISDAFVVVSTDGVPDIPVLKENQRVGVTRKDGRLLIPWLTAYYGAKFEIDPLDLPANVSTPVVEQRAAVKLGSGRLLRFPVRKISSATLILHDETGKPLALGAPVAANGEVKTYVGWGGVVYLEDATDLEGVTVNLPNGKRCGAAFSLPKGESVTVRLGPLTCR